VTDRAHVSYRLATEADLDACIGIWRVGIDDYQGRLNIPPLPPDSGYLRRYLAHVLQTDPNRFWVAARQDGGTPIGFSSATVRGSLWFLGMLFVDPARQGDGIGRALLDRSLLGREPEADAAPDETGPVTRWGTCTDVLQPISNALYARYGMVPRIPVWRMVGNVRDRSALGPLPTGLRAVEFETVVEEDDGHRRLADAVNTLDADVLGFERPGDHAWLRRERFRGVLVLDGDMPVGYAYASAVGRVGPIAARDPELVAPVLGCVLDAVPANGARATWIPGSAAGTFRGLLRAGMRLDGYPGLLCWSTAETPFDRYIPISLALV